MDRVGTYKWYGAAAVGGYVGTICFSEEHRITVREDRRDVIIPTGGANWRDHSLVVHKELTVWE